jgi:CheY-like chemotaxis protein
MKILLIESDLLKRENLKKLCESLPINAQVFETGDLSVTTDLKIVAEMNFILCVDDQQNQDHIATLKELLRQKFPHVGHLLSGPSLSEVVEGELVDFYSQLNNVSHEYRAEEYLGIRIVYFLRFNRVLKNIFIKLSDEKYLKVFSKDNSYNRQDILKYKSKGATHLYVLVSDFDMSKESIEQEDFLTLDKDIDTNSTEDIFLSTTEVIQDLIKETGINKQIINMVDYAVYKIEEQLSNSKDGLALLMKQFQARGDYLSDSACAVSYFSCMICSKMNWDSEETRQKLIFASILHDVYVDNPTLAKAMDFEEDVTGRFAGHRIDEYKLHPIKIADKIKLNTKLPLNLEELVMCHHEDLMERDFRVDWMLIA